MITKQQAATLWANSYELQDKKGNIYSIIGIENAISFKVLRRDKESNQSIVYFDKIGTDYFILCRPLSDLTKEIKGIGVPIEILKNLIMERGNYRHYDASWLKTIDKNYQFPEWIGAWLDKHHFIRGVSEDCLIYIE